MIISGGKGLALELALVFGCWLLAAGLVLFLIGFAILAMRPRSDWARRITNFGGMSMAAALPAMIAALLLPL